MARGRERTEKGEGDGAIPWLVNIDVSYLQAKTA
jgi:hypothetical protein